ncbi:MAG TPA: hypothetical protein VFZ16_05315 [Hyphomicrobiaceae bacterium]|nr:hypothetical protein [Hyphomicrobiaceae bacterium]
MTNDDKRVRETVQAELRRRRGVPEKDYEDPHSQRSANGSYGGRLVAVGRRQTTEQR